MKTRILIVEDHADSAEFLRLLLEPEGYIVQVAASGQQARESLTSFKPEIILMDVMLPDVEGLDLLRELRAASPETCVIVVSEPPPEGRARRSDDLLRHHWAQQADAAAVSAHQIGGADRRQRADHRGKRKRQRGRRDGHPRVEQAREGPLH